MFESYLIKIHMLHAIILLHYCSNLHAEWQQWLIFDDGTQANYSITNGLYKGFELFVLLALFVHTVQIKGSDDCFFIEEELLNFSIVDGRHSYHRK